METEDFDVDSLASFLNLTPTEVQKLASRDKIPGRRIGGEWKFSRAEIHHWLEDRIGATDDEGELKKVEAVVTSAIAETPADTYTLTELLSRESVIVPLTAKSRRSVINAVCDHAMSIGLLWDSDKMADALIAREELHPTALDNGVALLHPRRPLPNIIGEPFLLLARTWQGVPFGGPRGNLTDIFFLIASTSDQVHLKTLARLSRLLNDPEALPKIREAETADETYDAFVQLAAEID